MNSTKIPDIGSCIYCDTNEDLTNEHFLPYGLGGKEILKKASCKTCAKETSQIEERLMRGIWRPYRQALNLPSRSKIYPRYYPVELVTFKGEKKPVQIPTENYPAVIFFVFETPSVLLDRTHTAPPSAKEVLLKLIRPFPTKVLEEQKIRAIQPWEQIEYPVNFESSDLLRFIAKVAHGYVHYRHDLPACRSYFLPPIILGNSNEALTYIGGCSSELLKPWLPGKELHRFFEREQSGFRIINMQFFCDGTEPPPIYEAIVGKL